MSGGALPKRRGRGLIVGIGFRTRDDVGRRRGTLEDLAFVVGFGVGDLVSRGERLDLILAEAGTVRIGEGAEGNAERVTGAADLLVHLETALQLRLIVNSEHAGEGPVLTRRLGLVGLVLRERRKRARGDERHGREGKGRELETDHRWNSLGAVAHQPAATAAVFVLVSTASAIDVGIGFVFSVKLRTGMMMRKKAK